MRILVLLVFLNCVISDLCAQVGVPSLSALQSIRSTNAQGLYTGHLKVYVPLYEFSGIGMNLPIGLSYNTRGVKVNDNSGILGMNWSLQAGGNVSRVVRGVPDEEDSGMCNIASNDILNADNEAIFDGSVDGEPDIYYYSYPGGSGKFYIEDGRAYTIPYQDVLIDLSGFCANTDPDHPGSFKITDQYGYQYLYENSAGGLLNDYSKYLDGENVGDLISNNQSFTVDNWNLTEIKDHNGISQFFFEYPGIPQLYHTRSDVYDLYLPLDGKCGEYSQRIVKSRSISTRAYDFPSKISNNRGSIEFSKEAWTGNIHSYINITVSDFHQNEVFRYRLHLKNYAALSNPQDETSVCPVNTLELSRYPCRRKYLEKIEKISSDNNDTIVYRSFEYIDPDKLPPRNSAFQDFWGYARYHFAAVDYGDYRSTIPKIQIQSTRYGYADKQPSSYDVYAKRGLLKAMNLGTGGRVEYEYERNKGEPISGNSSQFQSWFGYFDSPYGPGFRIKEVRAYAGDQYSNDQVVKFEYFGGRFKQPYLVWRIDNGPVQVEDEQILACDEEYLVISSSSQNALYDLDGNDIGYEKVREVRADGSWTEYSFTNRDYEDLPPNTYLNSHLNVLAPEGPPFSPYTSQSWKRGLVWKVDQYDVQGDLVKRTENEYQLNTDAKHQLTAKFVDQQVVGKYTVGEYTVRSSPVSLTTSRTLLIDQGASGNYAGTVTYNEFENAYNYLRSSSIIDSNGDTLKREYVYPFDLVTSQGEGDLESQGVYHMKSRHLHGVPIEIIDYRNGFTTNGVLTTYRLFSNSDLHPYRSYVLENKAPLTNGLFGDGFFRTHNLLFSQQIFYDDRYELLTEFLDYNDEGQLRLSLSRGDIIQENSYDTGHHLDSKSIYSLEAITNCILPDESIDATCVLSTPKPWARTQSFSYRRMIGLSSKTDINGRRTIYEYDNFGRLKLVQDHEGNIVQKYEYKLLNQSGVDP